MSDRYYYRLIGDPNILGPHELSGLQTQTKGLRNRYEAVPAIGQSYGQLKRTKDWVRVDSLLSALPEVTDLAPVTATTHCHVFCAGQQRGPYLPQQIQTMWNTGKLTADTSVLPAGFPNWIPIATFLAQLHHNQTAAATPPSGARSIGILLTVVGISVTVYFAALYDTSVYSESRYIPEVGYLGGSRVVNLGKQQDRLIGVIIGIAMTVGGIVLICLPKRSNDP